MTERLSLPAAVTPAAAVNQPVAGGRTRLWWLGGASFVIRTPRAVLWLDPFFGPPARPEFHRQRPPLLDASEIDTVTGIAITHEHNDHCHIPTLAKMAEGNAPFPLFAPSVSADKVRSGLPDMDVRTVGPGHTQTLEDITFTVYSGNDPLADEGIMYLLATPGGRMLFPGDSLYSPGFFSEFGSHRIDVSCFSVGDLLFGKKAYMTPAEFGMAADEVGAEISIPVHWDLWEEAKVDPAAVEDWGTPSVEVLTPGEGLELSQTGASPP